MKTIESRKVIEIKEESFLTLEKTLEIAKTQSPSAYVFEREEVGEHKGRLAIPENYDGTVRLLTICGVYWCRVIL